MRCSKEAGVSMFLLALSLSAPFGPDGLCPQSAAARRIAREIIEAFGRETVEHAEPRIARLVESHGDDASRALRRVGAGGVPLLEKHGAGAATILAKWGDDGLRLLATEGDAATALLSRHGDEAVDLMIRHPGVGGRLLEIFGPRVARSALSTEGAVTLQRLSDPIVKSGRADQILAVVERFGDRACRFLWRNKGTVFLGAVLTAFLADPEPYLDGLRELVVQPASDAAQEAVRRTNWTVVFIAVLLAGGLAWLGRRWLRGRAARQVA